MTAALIALFITVLVVAVVAAVIIYCLDLLPVDPSFQKILRALVLLIAALIIIFKALPLLGVAV